MPKQYQYEVEVTRTRAITESTTVEVDSPEKLTEDEAFDKAKALARDVEDGDWEESDCAYHYDECDIVSGEDDLKGRVARPSLPA